MAYVTIFRVIEGINSFRGHLHSLFSREELYPLWLYLLKGIEEFLRSITAMVFLKVIKPVRVCHARANHNLVGVTGGPVFLVKVLAFYSLLYWDCLTLEIRKQNNRALQHVADVFEVDLAAFFWQQIHLIRLVYSITIVVVVMECLLGVVATKALTTNEFPASVFG